MGLVVAVLALDGVVPFELAIPGQVFGTANLAAGTPHYALRICAPGRGATTSPEHGAFRMHTPYDLDGLAGADTVVIPAHAGFLDPPPPPVVEALQRAAARGARLASVCVGAFTLAATGLLDGHRATTHWQFADELARRHPRVEVDPAVLFVDHGSLITSAGVAAGLDLCLHLVRRDLGADLAAATARRTVMPLQRDGGQAQYIERPEVPTDLSALQPVLRWMESHLHRPLTLAEIAGHAGVSVRTLNRRFRDQTGTTPLQWLLRARIHRAQQLLETTDLPVPHVADRSGFGSAPALRHHFGRHTRTSPHAYRAAFRQRHLDEHGTLRGE
ncbi:helix-turn-helix domain-containing protein [Streptomyces sp. SCA3-4]|uniref:GlxA family transcriptional regulator n=1 Tax=Streptomyces sichuanensis TaxID=2871810 RepID=UPI001CE2D2DF|nr:helix-turn-helix domain-containing protein [Streptomyces sichuanensis]MCA6092864.1 helix-turn-helix domain-containing protein [Streptomyces sichuanensis]